MAAYAGKVVVVTGASQGIGKALCLELAAQRPRLVLAARDAAALEAVAAECRARGAETLVVPTDVGDEAACRALVERAVERFGGVDVLVNNAGMGMLARFEDVTDLSLYERLMRVNYLGSVYPTFYALPHLKRSRGQIVAVSSLAGLNGVPMRTAYAATKHAQMGFFDSLRIELRDDGRLGDGDRALLRAVGDPEALARARRADGRGVPREGSRDHERRGVRAAHGEGHGEAPADARDELQGEARAVGEARRAGPRGPDGGGGGAQGKVRQRR